VCSSDELLPRARLLCTGCRLCPGLRRSDEQLLPGSGQQLLPGPGGLRSGLCGSGCQQLLPGPDRLRSGVCGSDGLLPDEQLLRSELRFALRS
jgi:hypothetical protein